MVKNTQCPDLVVSSHHDEHRSGEHRDILGCPMMSFGSGSTAALGADWSSEAHCDIGSPEWARTETRPAFSSTTAAVSGHCSAADTGLLCG